MFDRPWTSQPQCSVGLDKSSPLMQGLLFHAPLHPQWGMRDLVSGAPAVRTGLAARGVNKYGALPLFGASNYADFNAPPTMDGAQPFTIAWVQQPISPAGYGTVLDIRPPVNAANSFLIYQSASDTSYQFVVGPRDGGGNGKQAQFAMGTQTSGQLDVYVLVAPAGLATASAAYVLYRNGVRQAAAAASPPFGAASPTGMRFGTVLGATSDPFEGLLGGLTIWQRILSDAEGCLMSARPSAIYAPLRRPWLTPAPVIAPAGNTIAVPVGALTLTWQVPTVVATANQTVAVPSGSLTLIGLSPTVNSSAAQTIQVPAGALTLTVLEPTVVATANQTIAAPAGSLSLTGLAPAVVVNASNTVQVPSGALSLTALAPSVVYTADNVVSVPVGFLSLAGYAPTVTNGEEVVQTGAGRPTSKQRYVVKVGNKLHEFGTAQEATDAMEVDARLKRKNAAAEIKPVDEVAAPKPVAEVSIAEVKTLAKTYQAENRIQDLFKQQDYSQMLRVYEALRQQQDDEDVELLLMAL